MDEEKITLRKLAIQSWLNGVSRAEIARQLGRSWFWVDYWINRYQPDNPEASLSNRSSVPQHPYRAWPEEIRELVFHSRQARMTAEQPGYRYALIGAQAIHYELRELGIDPTPPVRTIHYWLKQAKQIQKKLSRTEQPRVEKTYPAPKGATINAVHQFDLKGPFYLKGNTQKHYLCALRDVKSKRVALGVILDKQMDTLIDFLIMAWHKLGLPDILQMDNGLEFRGSNRYPRSPGRLLRVALDLGIEPLFIPPHEPWRNGVIENLNGLLQRLLLNRETFQSFLDLERCANAIEQAINTSHRLDALHGKTPAEYTYNSDLRRPPVGYNWRKRDLQLVKGRISFIRLVRKSGRITLTANDKFEIGTEYQWQYVLATVNIAAKQLEIFFDERLIKSFDYP